MVDVANIFLMLLDKFGMNIAQMGLMVFLFYKLYTNHLAHIHTDIKDTKKSVGETKEKIDALDKKTDELGERVANIEGRLEAPQKAKRK